MANKKLKGIVKTGQDALKDEQTMVKSLQDSLADSAKVKTINLVVVVRSIYV